jgi:hypothetical protein
MLVTSTWEVLGPSAADFIKVFLNYSCGLVEPGSVEPIVRGHFDGGLQPELCLSVGMIHVDMHPTLFAGKEVEAEPTDAKNGRTHVVRITETAPLPRSPAGTQRQNKGEIAK